jgi:uncharacterized protein with ATP-grasp and redox domains
MVRRLHQLELMPDQEPDFAQILKQFKESMRTLKLHVITYRTRVIGLSMRNQSKITDLPDPYEEKKERGN